LGLPGKWLDSLPGTSSGIYLFNAALFPIWIVNEQFLPGSLSVKRVPNVSQVGQNKLSTAAFATGARVPGYRFLEVDLTFPVSHR
jgi:hypothetical protein